MPAPVEPEGLYVCGRVLYRRPLRTCQYAGEPLHAARSHPWTDAVGDAACRYYDFVREPGLIRTALEDFVPWSHYPAVESMYALLERLNGPASGFESNDCAFAPPQASAVSHPGRALQCEGRLMILYRDLVLNLSRKRIEDVETRLHMCLAALDPSFEAGLIGTTIAPVRYLALPLAPAGQLGHQLMISFWAWGSAERDVMHNLARVVENMGRGLGEVSN